MGTDLKYETLDSSINLKTERLAIERDCEQHSLKKPELANGTSSESPLTVPAAGNIDKQFPTWIGATTYRTTSHDQILANGANFVKTGNQLLPNWNDFYADVKEQRRKGAPVDPKLVASIAVDAIPGLHQEFENCPSLVVLNQLAKAYSLAGKDAHIELRPEIERAMTELLIEMRGHAKDGNLSHAAECFQYAQPLLASCTAELQQAFTQTRAHALGVTDIKRM